MDDDQLEALRVSLSNVIPFVERTGFEVVELRRGYCRARMPLEPNVNHIGTMYAGALYTLAEVPGGALALATFDPSRYYPVVKDMRIRFTALARTDIEVAVSLDDDQIARIQAEVDERGKADWQWECHLTDTDGTVVAITENLYQLRAHGT
jgi:acyl-coenzyme A thioesterase PaaI-like protein